MDSTMRRFATIVFLVVSTPLARAGDGKPAAKVYHVPYRLTSTSHVLIRAKINGQGPYNFILDTGAPTLFVSTGVCRKLKIPANDNGWGTFDRFEIEGGVVLEKCRGRIEDPFQLEGMNGLGLAGVELHGILGYTVLARYRLGFDFTQNKMTWQALDFEPPRPAGMDQPSMPSGMEALGSVLKFVGAFVGKKAPRETPARGFLGLLLEESATGVTAKEVLPGGPAAEAGIKAGDTITRFKGKKVGSVVDLQSMASTVGPDETVEVQISRGTATRSLRVKTGKGF
jgi:hypothetical protein